MASREAHNLQFSVRIRAPQQDTAENDLPFGKSFSVENDILRFMEKNIITFIKEHSLATLSTCADNKPHGVPIYYYYSTEENTFYFVTKSETRKIANLKANPIAFLSVTRTNPPAVFTADCEAKIYTQDINTDKKRLDIAKKLIKIHTEQEYYPTPLHSLKDGDLTFVSLQIKTHSYNDYRTN